MTTGPTGQPRIYATITPLAPTLETARLRLRGWQARDIEPFRAMMADPEVARFITAEGQALNARQAWLQMSMFAGHWALYGHGMFVVEDKATGVFLGRVGTLMPPFWPGFEIGWGIARARQGKGFATEAADAAIDWAFATFDVNEIIHLIARDNAASRAVARRLGAEISGDMPLFGYTVDIWASRREPWQRLHGR